MNLRYVLSFLRLLRIPGLLPVMKDWQAFIRMHFIFAAYESGLLEVLTTGPCEKETLIEALHVERPELLDALLDIGLSIKELAFKNNRYFIRGKRSRAIMHDKGDIIAAMIQANITYYSDAYRNAAQRIKGAPLGDDLEKIGDLVARFSKGAEPVIQHFVKILVAAKKHMRILDVGCGSGVFMKSAYESNTNASGIGMDIDDAVVLQARNNMKTWQLENRFVILQADIRIPPAEVVGTFDLITLFNNLYYFEEQERIQLLKYLRSILSSQGVLAIVMNFKSGGKDIAAANLNLVNCSLKGLTPLPEISEIQMLLKQCGFEAVTIHRFIPGSAFCGISAVNPEKDNNTKR